MKAARRQRWPEAYRRAARRQRAKLRLAPGEPRISARASLLGGLAIRDQSTVGALMNISRQRVQALERKAIHKIRQALTNFSEAR